MSVRRAGVVPFVLVLMFCWREAQSPAAATPARAESTPDEAQRVGGGGRFDPDDVKPARNSARKAALEARAAGDLAGARSKALAGMVRAKGEEAIYLRWIAAQASRGLGDPGGAAALWLPIAESDHPLSSWAKLSVAECYESKDPLHALALLDSLLAPSRDMQGWPGRTPAERARARVLDKLGRREDSIAAFERLAADATDQSALVQVLLPLAEMLQSGDEPQRVRAYTLARKVAQRVAPETRAGKRADELAKSLLETLPSELQKELTRPRPEDKLERADELAAALRYDDAVAAYEAVEAAAKDEPEVLCRARAARAKALLDKRARADGAALMIDVIERCPLDANARAWARYNAGRALSAIGQNEAAIAQYEALERESPGHTLADDALYRAARVAKDMDDSAGLVSRLTLLSQRYPLGDMLPRARFALAWEAAYGQGDLQTAIDIVSADPRDETTEDLQGRSAYYRARWLADIGELPAAVEAYAAAFERTPLSFYGQLAYSRLHALAPERAKEQLSKLNRARGVKLTFARRPELASAGFKRVFALLSAGETSLASWELRVLGFSSEGADVELGMLAVALLDRAEAPDLALGLVRRHMPQLLQRAPVGGDVALYELVYPVAFEDVIERAAKKEGVPAAFVRGVAREESGFNPDAVSRAHAYGLVQLLVPTARSLVKSKKERVKTGKELLKPELNLTLGARYMSSLAASHRHGYALVPPAYNAGPAAVSRWLRERGAQSLDTWVENIPYDETRGYTRRVLQSYGIYHWLATGEMLSLPLTPVGGQPAALPDSSTQLTTVRPAP